MTDQEKLEFLLKALEENDWDMSHYGYNLETGEMREIYANLKNGIDMCIVYDNKNQGFLLKIYMIYKKCEPVFVLASDTCEVYADHIEFVYEGVAMEIRLADGHVFMEYEPEEIEE